MSVFIRPDQEHDRHVQDFKRRYGIFQSILHGQGIYTAAITWYRSNSVQAMLYSQGRTAPGQRVTNAPPGKSPHNYAVAIDSQYTDHRPAQANRAIPLTRAIATAAHKAGLTWGGNWQKLHDTAHVELPGWKKIYL